MSTRIDTSLRNAPPPSLDRFFVDDGRVTRVAGGGGTIVAVSGTGLTKGDIPVRGPTRARPGFIDIGDLRPGPLTTDRDRFPIGNRPGVLGQYEEFYPGGGPLTTGWVDIAGGLIGGDPSSEFGDTGLYSDSASAVDAAKGVAGGPISANTAEAVRYAFHVDRVSEPKSPYTYPKEEEGPNQQVPQRGNPDPIPHGANPWADLANPFLGPLPEGWMTDRPAREPPKQDPGPKGNPYDDDTPNPNDERPQGPIAPSIRFVSIRMREPVSDLRDPLVSCMA